MENYEVRYSNKIHKIYLNTNLIDKYFAKKTKKFNYNIVDKAVEKAKSNKEYDIIIKLIDLIESCDFDEEVKIMRDILKNNLSSLEKQSESIYNSNDYIEGKSIYDRLVKSIKYLKNDISKNYTSILSTNTALLADKHNVDIGNKYAERDGYSLVKLAYGKRTNEDMYEDIWKERELHLSDFSSSDFKNECENTINAEYELKKQINYLKKVNIKKPNYKYNHIVDIINNLKRCIKRNRSFIDVRNIPIVKYNNKSLSHTKDNWNMVRSQRDKIDLIYYQSIIQLMDLDIFINNSCCRKIISEMKIYFIRKIFSIFTIYNSCKNIDKTLKK